TCPIPPDGSAHADGLLVGLDDGDDAFLVPGIGLAGVLRRDLVDDFPGDVAFEPFGDPVKNTSWPSWVPTKTGVVWGEPSGRTVARCPSEGPVRWASGHVASASRRSPVRRVRRRTRAGSRCPRAAGWCRGSCPGA